MAKAREIEEVWKAPDLSLEDERLINAYRRLGEALDELPYTEEFEDFCHSVGVRKHDRDGYHRVFKRLITLRKQGRLPRRYGA